LFSCIALDIPYNLWYPCATNKKEAAQMAKHTIEELYRGDKYSILSAVGAKAIRAGIDPNTADGQTWLEMELIRQTFITAKKMKQNGDCIAESELGDAVTVSVCGEAEHEHP